jgi:hypothetical protein
MVVNAVSQFDFTFAPVPGSLSTQGLPSIYHGPDGQESGVIGMYAVVLRTPTVSQNSSSYYSIRWPESSQISLRWQY